jgi:ParB family chromosome partitioning protein
METECVYEKGQLYQIALSDLQTDSNQPRKVIEPQALDELTTSIAKMGVVQPIVFRQDDSNNLVIVAGERRVVAARAAVSPPSLPFLSKAITPRWPWWKTCCGKTSPR